MVVGGGEVNLTLYFNNLKIIIVIITIIKNILL